MSNLGGELGNQGKGLRDKKSRRGSPFWLGLIQKAWWGMGARTGR